MNKWSCPNGKDIFKFFSFNIFWIFSSFFDNFWGSIFQQLIFDKLYHCMYHNKLKYFFPCLVQFMWLIFYFLDIFFRSLRIFFCSRIFFQTNKIIIFKSGTLLVYVYVHGFLMGNVKILWLKLNYFFQRIKKFCP